MLKALFRVRLLALKSWINGSTRVKKAQSKGKLIGFAALMIYALAALGFMFWHVFDTLGEAFHAFGFDWLYFTMLAIMSFAIMFIGSIFTAKAQLYEARDNDLLLSMPIKPLDILLSRMFMLWVIAFVLDILASVPALMVWGHITAMTGAHIVSFVLIILVALPLLTLSIGALFGWLISLATARMKRKALATTLFSLIFLAAYFYFYIKFNAMLGDMAANAARYAENLGSVPLLYRIGAAIAGGDVLTAAVITAATLAIFAVVCAVLTATFTKTATNKVGGSKNVYVEKEAKVRSAKAAILKREAALFFGCPAYFLNAGLGAIFAPVGAVVLLIYSNKLQGFFAAMTPELRMLILDLIPIGLCMLCSMTVLTAPSVSLEGRTLWISRSLPVATTDILRAKLRLHYLVGVPSMLILSIAAAIAFKGGAEFTALVIVMPLVFTLFMGVFGLNANLRHPNFDWANETQAVKSSMSALIAIFGSWGILMVPTIVFLVFGDVVDMSIVGWIFTALMAAVTYIIYRRILTKGVERYERM